MQPNVTCQSGNFPLRYMRFVMPIGTNRGRRLVRNIAAIISLCLIHNATIEPLIVLFMLSSEVQTFATISLLTMYIFRCFSIMSTFKFTALQFIVTVGIFQMGSLLYLHSIFIFISFIISGALHGSLKTIFQAYTVLLAKRNPSGDPNFTCTSNRLFTFFAINRALELIGNALGFLITAATFSTQMNVKFETSCGREFCFITHRDDLISSISSISNFFMIFTRKFIPISTQFIFYALLCIGVFIAITSLRSINGTFIDTSTDQSPIDILAKTSFNDLLPLGIASGYLDVFIFYEISNAVIYCVTSNVIDVCAILTCVLLFIVLFIIFITAILTNSVSLDALPIFFAALTGIGCMAVLWFWRPIQGDLPMLYIIVFLSSITSVVFTFISYKYVLERHGGDNGVMSVEFCRDLGSTIAFVLRLHPCMYEKIIATTIIICISILPFLFKVLIKNNNNTSSSIIDA